MTQSAQPDPTARFSERVYHYVASRPSYPSAVLDTLELYTGLGPGAVVADIGSGTGIFSQLLLDRGYEVYGVEPNAGMRNAAEQLLAEEEYFYSVAGRAEDTQVPTASCDAVVAAQAFHWFDTARTRAEVERILKPGGVVVLLWNQRHLDTTPFLRDYEAFLQSWGNDYAQVAENYEDPEAIAAIFRGGEYRVDTFPNVQHFDGEGLCSRALSCSYMPGVEDPQRVEMLLALHALFDRHAENDRVTFSYDTRMYSGRIQG